jgi:putative redox protein
MSAAGHANGEPESVLVSETRLGQVQVLVRTGAGSFVADEPRSAGGLGSGPGPYDLLSAALGACKAMTVRLYARRKAWPLERVQVRVRHRRPSLTAPDEFDCEVELEGPLDEDQRQRLVEIAARCPVHRTLERGSKVSTRILADPAPATIASSSKHLRDMESTVDEG